MRQLVQLPGNTEHVLHGSIHSTQAPWYGYSGGVQLLTQVLFKRYIVDRQLVQLLGRVLQVRHSEEQLRQLPRAFP